VRDAVRQSAVAPDLYRILGLGPSAESKEITAAYRALAKQYHPDINVDDTAAEQRTKEINRAYQILGDPEARAAYDRERAHARATARGRFWKGVATGIVTFILVASLVGMLTFFLVPHDPGLTSPSGRWRVPDENDGIATKPPKRTRSGAAEKTDVGSGSIVPQRPQALPAPMGEVAPWRPSAQDPVGQIGSIALPPAHGPLLAPPRDPVPPSASAAPAPASGPPRAEIASPGPPRIADEQPPPPAAATTPALPRGKPAIWKLYQNTRSGFVLSYPADVFSVVGDDMASMDRLLMSKDGRAVLRITSLASAVAVTAGEYRQSLMIGRYAGATFDDTPRGRRWFVLSGMFGEEKFYERVTFSCDARSAHGWLLVYPLSERPYFDAIIAEIERSYRYDLDPNGRCGEPMSKGADPPKRH
jgi:hypothetical protein